MAFIRAADQVIWAPDGHPASKVLQRRIDPSYEYYHLDMAVRPLAISGVGPYASNDASLGTFTTLWSNDPGPGGGIVGPCYQVGTGTSAAGRVSWGQGQSALIFSFSPDYDFAYHRCLARVDILSDAVQEFSARFGWSDSASAGPPVDGAAFSYVRSVTGPNWICENRSGNVGAVVDTGIPVDTAWHEFVTVYDGRRRNMSYWMDGVNLTAIGTLVPEGVFFGGAVTMAKLVGTTRRDVSCAYQETYVRWLKPRGVPLPSLAD